MSDDRIELAVQRAIHREILTFVVGLFGAWLLIFVFNHLGLFSILGLIAAVGCLIWSAIRLLRRLLRPVGTLIEFVADTSYEALARLFSRRAPTNRSGAIRLSAFDVPENVELLTDPTPPKFRNVGKTVVAYWGDRPPTEIEILGMQSQERKLGFYNQL